VRMRRLYRTAVGYYRMVKGDSVSNIMALANVPLYFAHDLQVWAPRAVRN
jgi:hypothetical protein